MSTVGTAVSRERAGGVVAGGDGLGGGGEREQRVAPAVGRRAGVRGAAVGLDLDRARRLAAHDHALGALGRELARLEAQARVPAGEALRVRERRRPPLLVADEQQRDLGERVAAGGERAEHAEREDDAALHVDGAGAEQLLAVARERLVVLVADHRVDVAEQQQAAGAGAGDAQQQVGRVAGGGAGEALRGRVARRERGADRRALLGAADVARGRGDADERLELPLRARRDLLRAAPRPSRPYSDALYARVAGDGDRRAAPGRGAARPGGRVGARARHQRAEDVRPAAARARGPGVHGRQAPRQAARARARRARRPRAPDDGRAACSSTRSAARCATRRRG